MIHVLAGDRTPRLADVRLFDDDIRCVAAIRVVWKIEFLGRSVSRSVANVISR